ncbi:MAG: hypothetical protein E6Q76_14930 [Rhizobium sp.]|nr:MAG: hypothetical protein E6Q76_14930 [Rhizobium sp.]
MMNERRRLAAQKAFDRIRQAGLSMEEDPRFLAWIEQWVAGEIEMSEVRERYLGLLRARTLALKTGVSIGVATVPSGLVMAEEADRFLGEIAEG